MACAGVMKPSALGVAPGSGPAGPEFEPPASHPAFRLPERAFAGIAHDAGRPKDGTPAGTA